MSNGQNDETDQFLRRFFGEGNALQFEQLENPSDEKRRLVRIWTEPLRREESLPTVLPRFSKTGTTQWYGIARSPRQLRMLAEDVRAFVGPTYSTFDGQRAQLVPSDSVEEAVQVYTHGNAFRFAGNDRAIARALRLMHEVRERGKERSAPDVQSVGVVLRTFEMALQAGHRSEAERHHRRLRERKLLDTVNLRFTRVRMLEAFGAWTEMLELSDLADLLATRRPLPVTQALIRAVYRTELLPFERDADPEGAVAHFRESVWPRYGAPFSAHASLHAPEVLKAFMMQAVRENDPDLRDELLDVAEQTNAASDFLSRLAALIQHPASPPPENPLEVGFAAYGRGDFDAAFRLARQADPSKGQIQLLAFCAHEIESLEAEMAVQQALRRFTPEERESLLKDSAHGALLEPFVQRVDADQATPTDWLDWFRLLERGALTKERARRTAERGAVEWSIEDFLNIDGGVRRLAEAINQHYSIERRRALNEALPHLLGFLKKDPSYPRPVFREIYDRLLERVVYADALGDADLELFSELAEVLFAQRTARERRAEIAEYAGDLWNTYGGLSRLEWLLDFLDLLAVYANSSHPEITLQLLESAASAFQRFYQRTNAAQQDLFSQLCDELGHREISEGLSLLGEIGEKEHARTSLWDRMEGHTIGIYTLMEGVGQRAKGRIKRNCDDVAVHFSSAKEGNKRLQQLARNVDVFVVVHRSATHAATDFIKDHRGDLPILYPDGKGISSMIRTLDDYF